MQFYSYNGALKNYITEHRKITVQNYSIMPLKSLPYLCTLYNRESLNKELTVTL